MVLTELIFNSFLFGIVWLSWIELIFNTFYCWDCVVVLKELILITFHFGWVGWS